MFNTVQTRLRLTTTQVLTIDSCVGLWSWGSRKTWQLYNNLHLSEKQIYRYLSDLNLFTSSQIKSLINKVKTEHSKMKELTKSQLKQHEAKLDNISKFVNKQSKIIAKNIKEISSLKKEKILNYANVSELANSVKKKQLLLEQKQIKHDRISKSISLLQNRIKSNTFKLCFGSSKLLSQRPGNHSDKFRLTDEQKVYKDLTDWKHDWDLSRNNLWLSIGDKTKPQGNPEIQYYPTEKKLRLRITEKEYRHRLQTIANDTGINFKKLNDHKIVKSGEYRKQARFIEIEDVSFCAENQAKIVQAISNRQPITAKIVKKLTPTGEIGFYLQLSFEEIAVNQIVLTAKPKIMGIDLNQKGLAYCIVKPDGNKLKDAFGFIEWDLEDKSTEQRQYIVSNTITELLNIAQGYGVYAVAIERLDFTATINNMNSGYKTNQRYSKMLTGFAKTQFKELIVRKAERLGMSVNLVNASYSSVGGYAKYGLTNKLPVDIAAALWLARQAIFGKQYKKENHVKFIKKHEESVSLPYLVQPKQSKKLVCIEKEWKDISSELGTNRRLWYSNIIKYIQANSVSELLLQDVFQDLTSSDITATS